MTHLKLLMTLLPAVFKWNDRLLGVQAVDVQLNGPLDRKKGMGVKKQVYMFVMFVAFVRTC